MRIQLKQVCLACYILLTQSGLQYCFQCSVSVIYCHSLCDEHGRLDFKNVVQNGYFFLVDGSKWRDRHIYKNSRSWSIKRVSTIACNSHIHVILSCKSCVLNQHNMNSAQRKYHNKKHVFKFTDLCSLFFYDFISLCYEIKCRLCAGAPFLFIPNLLFIYLVFCYKYL